MILKLLLVAAVIMIVYTLFFKRTSVTTKKPNKQTKDTPPVNELVQCPTCGVYIEMEEAILSGSSYYCSTECINKAT